MRPVFATLRLKYGHSCLGYIDDSIYIEDSLRLSHDATFNATQLFLQLGFVPHPSKSVFQPTQILEFILTSVTVTVSLTAKKITKVTGFCKQILTYSKITIRQLASI